MPDIKTRPRGGDGKKSTFPHECELLKVGQNSCVTKQRHGALCCGHPLVLSLVKCPVPERQRVALLSAAGSQCWLFYCSGLEERRKPAG